MTHSDHHREQIAAYLAGELSPDDAASFEREMKNNPAFAAEVDSLSSVADWLADSFASGPSTDFHLSNDRLSLIRATARGDIVEFPQRAPSARKTSRVASFARRYGLAGAAAVAMMIGAISGFESGRIQVSEGNQRILVAVDVDDATAGDAAIDTVYLYPPAYGLDHADFSAMVSRSSSQAVVSSIGYASEPRGDYGLPGPGSPYLRSESLLFLQ